jgi:DNA-3-methyladenine glycosylase I
MTTRNPDTQTRCPWCGDDPLYVQYHDEEWGVPVHDDHKLFEMLTLEGAQAGLNWLTVLRKRRNYRLALDGLNPEIVAAYDPGKIDALMSDAGLIRHRGKLESTVTNARAFLDIRESHGSFDAYLWDFVDGEPVQNRFRSIEKVPASTPLSDRISRDLKARGFKFMGTTICYAYMQAVGLVNDHLVDCFRHRYLDRA